MPERGHTFLPPEQQADDKLIEHLGRAQERMRALMTEHGIESGHICVMARQAQRAIPDAGVRAAFLACLIDLHAFGAEAKRRGILGAATDDGARGAGPPRPAPPAEPPPEPPRAAAARAREAAAAGVDKAASDAFFKRLDDEQ